MLKIVISTELKSMCYIFVKGQITRSLILKIVISTELKSMCYIFKVK